MAITNTEKILGLKINLISESEVLGLINEAVLKHLGVQLVTANPEMILAGRRSEKLKTIINNAWLVLPDGVGLVWALKRKKHSAVERISGIDLTEKLFEIGNTLGWKFYFLGGAERVAEKAAGNIQEKYPGLKIGGFFHGYFTEEEKAEVIKKISKSYPDILLAGLGVPRQEKFIAENLAQLNSGVAIGIGGALDVLSGNLKRAPGIFRKLKIEWLFRLLQEPRRYKRIFSLLKFVVLNLFD